MNTKNEIIQKKFLEKISDATKAINVKVMLGDSTVKEVSTFDSKNIEIFFNKISIKFEPTNPAPPVIKIFIF